MIIHINLFSVNYYFSSVWFDFVWIQIPRILNNQFCLFPLQKLHVAFWGINVNKMSHIFCSDPQTCILMIDFHMENPSCDRDRVTCQHTFKQTNLIYHVLRLGFNHNNTIFTVFTLLYRQGYSILIVPFCPTASFNLWKINSI